MRFVIVLSVAFAFNSCGHGQPSATLSPGQLYDLLDERDRMRDVARRESEARTLQESRRVKVVVFSPVNAERSPSERAILGEFYAQSREAFVQIAHGIVSEGYKSLRPAIFACLRGLMQAQKAVDNRFVWHDDLAGSLLQLSVQAVLTHHERDLMARTLRCLYGTSLTWKVAAKNWRPPSCGIPPPH